MAKKDKKQKKAKKKLNKLIIKFKNKKGKKYYEADDSQLGGA